MKGPSEEGELFAVLEYMKGGQVVTHPHGVSSQEGIANQMFVGSSFFIAYENMGVKLKVSCFKHFLVFACFWERGCTLRCTHTMHSLMCVSVVVCVARKLRPCPSYSRRRDRISVALLHTLYKGRRYKEFRCGATL